MLNQKRLADLEELLSQDYEKLAYFERELGLSAGAPQKFELEQRIKREVLPTLRRHEAEYWELLDLIVSKYDIDNDEAQAIIDKTIQELRNLQGQQMSDELTQKFQQVLDKLNEIDDKLNEIDRVASAKAKVVVSFIPGLISYEIELETVKAICKVFEPLKQLIVSSIKK